MNQNDVTTASLRRNVTRATIVLAVIALLMIGGWTMLREPQEVQQSRAIKLGVKDSHVISVMGYPARITRAPNGDRVYAYGSTESRWLRWRKLLDDATGLELHDVAYEDWPVRVRFNCLNTVNQIARGTEIEDDWSKYR